MHELAEVYFCAKCVCVHVCEIRVCVGVYKVRVCACVRNPCVCACVQIACVCMRVKKIRGMTLFMKDFVPEKLFCLTFSSLSHFFSFFG